MLYQAVSEIASRRPQNIAMRPAGDEDVSYADFLTMVDRVAAGLVRHDVAAGDVVSCAMDNSAGYAAFILGIAKVGASYVPLIREFNAVDVRAALTLTRPRLHVTDGRRDCPVTGVPTVAIGALLAAGADRHTGPRMQRATVFRCLWTSGSTSFPKMIAWRQDRFLRERRRWLEHIGACDRDVFFCRHPLDVAHATDLHLFSALLTGAQLVLADPRSEPADLLAHLVKSAATVMSALPRHYDQLAAAAEAQGGLPLPHLRLPFTGGTYVGPAVVHRCQRELGITLRELYGSTEFGLAAVDLPDGGRDDGSVALVSGVNARIEPFAAAAPDIGELVLRSDCTSEGYLNDDLAHARTFRDGEYWTGDVARPTAPDRYRILGRVTETLASAHGPLVAPVLDDDIRGHCPVQESVSLAVAPNGQGRDVWLSVISLPGHHDHDVAAAVHDRLTYHGLRGEVRVVRELPVTAVGKPNKALLRAGWATTAASSHASAGSPGERP